MDNRKVILASYLSAAAVLGGLTWKFLEYLSQTFYQVRRLPGMQITNNVLPFLVAVICFVVLVRHPRINAFMDDVVSELRKVTWPGRDEVVRSTIVVLVCIAFCSAILGAFDVVWGRVIGYLLNS